MIECHFTLNLWHFFCVLCVFYGNRFIDGLENTLQISNVIDKVVEDISKVHDRLPEIGSIA